MQQDDLFSSSFWQEVQQGKLYYHPNFLEAAEADNFLLSSGKHYHGSKNELTSLASQSCNLGCKLGMATPLTPIQG